MLGYTQIRPCFKSRHLRWTDAFFQGALDYAGIQGFAPVGTKALNLVAGTHLLKVGSSLGWGQGFLLFLAKKQSIFDNAPHLCAAAAIVRLFAKYLLNARSV